MSPSVSSYWDSVWAVRLVYLGPCWLYSDLWWWFSYWNGFAFLNLWCSFRMLCRCLALAFRYLGKSSACPLPTLKLAKVFRWRFGWWWGRRSIESRAARDLIESLQVKLNCNKIFGLHCRGLAGQCIVSFELGRCSAGAIELRWRSFHPVNQLQLMYKDVSNDCSWQSLFTDEPLSLVTADGHIRSRVLLYWDREMLKCSPFWCMSLVMDSLSAARPCLGL